MKSINHFPSEDQKHFIKCECGEYIDMRDLEEILRHQHDIKIPLVDWDYSIRVGDSIAYTKDKKKLRLN
jgi:hypothetical protein